MYRTKTNDNNNNNNEINAFFRNQASLAIQLSKHESEQNCFFVLIKMYAFDLGQFYAS